jgi:hypothetical protein
VALIPEAGLSGIGGFPNIARMASRGNKLATIVSAFAFAFSGVSFYETVLKQPKLAVFVPPVIQYGRDGGGDVEVFAVPITVTNDGAQSGTILSMELLVEPPAGQQDTAKPKAFYSAFLGEHSRNPDTPNKSFAPISILGRATYSETVRFYPQGNPLPHVISDKGDFRLTLTLLTTAPANPTWIEQWLRSPPPKPLVFTRTLPWLSEQQLGFRRISISMHAADWKPTTGATK